ncbi:MAG TPA: type II secretion system minor pseudopilin GspJ [Gammaproteobacteria bacterium]|nr:type II secretion system minor pseudopilin GspJ [Gammaproteobacteria bacterium]
MSAHKQQHGFTLLEVLIASAVFAIMAVMAYSGLNMLIKQRAQSDAAMERLTELQRGFMIISRDLMQLRDRGIRGPYRGDYLPALNGQETSGYAMIFTRGGWRNPLGRQRSTLQRVAYRLEEDGLVRYSWLVLDQAQDSLPIRTVLVENVDRLSVRYLTREREWVTAWPPLDTSRNVNNAKESNTRMPQAIEIALDLPDYGRITRLYSIAGIN